MFNLKRLKVITSKTVLRALLAFVAALCTLVLMLPADLGALLAGAASNDWDGTLEPFENYSDSYSDFADGKKAYQIANAKQLAFLAAVLNATPTRTYFGPCKVKLDMNGDGTAETEYSFPGTGTFSKDETTMLVGAKFELTDDIDLGGLQWSPIGSSSLPFRATFEGNGHTVSGLSYVDETTPSGSSAGIGLFGKTGSTAIIKNLHVSGVVKTYQSNMGGIIGYCNGALEMENCSFSGTVQGGGWNYMANTGGLIGQVSTSNAVTIEDCFVYGEGTAITGATASGDKAAASYTPEAVGGLVGYVGANCDLTITDSYAESAVTGVNGSGGLVGTIAAGKEITNVLIERCYTAGKLISGSYVGGLVGWVRDISNEDENGNIIKTGIDLTIKDSYSVMDLTKATSTRAAGLISCSRGESYVDPEDVTISLIGCHFAGLNAKQPVMYYEDAYSTLKTVERVYYRADSTTSGSHTLQSYCEEKSRKAFMDGQVAALLDADRGVWATSMSAEYPVLGLDEKPSLSELTVNGETISLLDRVFEYTAPDVAHTVESIAVSAFSAQDGVTAAVVGADSDGYVALGIPGTTTAITVTATYNRVLTTTYTVNVYREPTPWDGESVEPFENYDPDYTKFLTGGSEGKYLITNGAQLAFLSEIINNVSSATYEAGTGNNRKYTVTVDCNRNGTIDADETFILAGNRYRYLLGYQTAALGADIDLNGNEWTPIGTNANPYKGFFDGEDHYVKNFTCTNTTATASANKPLGLFGFVAEGYVKNVHVREATLSCSNTGYVSNTYPTLIGGVVGKLQWGADLLNSSFDGTITKTGNSNAYAGGLVGMMQGSQQMDIINCWSSGTLSSSKNNTGGLVGLIYGSATGTTTSIGSVYTIESCYSTMNINAQTTGTAGLLGSVSSNVSYNAANGQYWRSTEGTLKNSYFAGTINNQYPIATHPEVPTYHETASSAEEHPDRPTTSSITLGDDVYFKEGWYTGAGAANPDKAAVGIDDANPLARQKSVAEFADGTVSTLLNDHLSTAAWVTSTEGNPVLSDLAVMLDNALDVLGTSIRTEGIQAIRFKFSVTDETIEAKELQKVGVLAAKASDKIVGEHLYTHDIAKDADNYYKYVDAIAYAKGGNKLSLIDDGSKFLFTAALYNLTEAKYWIDYIARAYATFVDDKGQELILYGETVGDEYFNSVYDIIDGFFNYPSGHNISMSDLLVLKNIYDERFAEEEVLPPEADVRAGGDNPQVGGAETEASDLRNTILNAEDVDPDDYNTVYYISPSGDDANDGTSPETAWKNVDAINLHNGQIQPGDAVLFERGGIYRSVASLLAEPIPEGVQSTSAQQIIYAQPGVTYGAYGEGAKPAIYSCHKNYAWGDPWRKSDKGENIWEVYTPRSDAGSVVFNHGEAVGIKRFGVWTGKTDSAGKKIYDGFITSENVGENLTENFEYYHDHRNGVLYLYLEGDKAPHELYEDIEICPRDGVFKVKSGVNDVHIDNLAIKYTGYYGIRGDEGTTGLTVTNCEMGWIGGCQWHFDTEAEGSRIGNAIELWETTTNARMENNWIYQVYDAGLSPQGVSSDAPSVYTNLVMRENLVEYCSYNIEWFDRNGSDVGKDHPSEWNGYYIEDNILRFAGYGFGRQRQDSNNAPSNICGWAFTYSKPLYVYIRNNIFDCSEKNTVYWRWSGTLTYPDTVISGNTFYEKASESGMTIYYGPNGKQWEATNQAELEEAIKTFDPDPKHVEWLPY